MESEARTRLGVVDCGTNTFTLHIADAADGRWQSVFKQRRFVRLGQDSFRSGRLSPLRMRRGLDVLDSFGQTARNYGVDYFRALGCSALRDAANGVDFVQAAQQRGWNIEVVDGASEAEWIHLGVKDTLGHLDLAGDSALTVDIGGGSVELIHWSQEAILGRWSLDLGVARLTDWIKPKDPLSQQDMASIRSVIDGALAPVKAAVAKDHPRWMVGTSGAFNTLRTMEDSKAPWNSPRQADGFNVEALKARCDALAATSKEDMHSIGGMHPDRVPYMGVACVVIGHLLEQFPHVERVYRSRHTLAEGVLVDGAARAQFAETLREAGWWSLEDIHLSH